MSDGNIISNVKKEANELYTQAKEIFNQPDVQQHMQAGLAEKDKGHYANALREGLEAEKTGAPSAASIIANDAFAPAVGAHLN